MILKWEVGKNPFHFPIFLAQAVQAAAAYFYPMANMKCQSFGCKNRRRGKTSRRVENIMLASQLRICSLDTIVNTVFVHLKLFNNTVFFFCLCFLLFWLNESLWKGSNQNPTLYYWPNFNAPKNFTFWFSQDSESCFFQVWVWLPVPAQPRSMLHGSSRTWANFTPC